jgi:hypothetical protein
MLLANNKYKLSCENGTWLAPSKGKEKILALEAQIRTHKNKGAGNKQKGRELQKTQTVKGKSRKAKKPDWFEKPPPKGASMATPKYWKEIPWYRCSTDTGGQCEGAWRYHKPSECQEKPTSLKRMMKIHVTNERPKRPAIMTNKSSSLPRQ